MVLAWHAKGQKHFSSHQSLCCWTGQDGWQTKVRRPTQAACQLAVEKLEMLGVRQHVCSNLPPDAWLTSVKSGRTGLTQLQVHARLSKDIACVLYPDGSVDVNHADLKYDMHCLWQLSPVRTSEHCCSYCSAGNPLMSIDIHPKGSRMATAGNSIEIWNMRPILDASSEADPAIPKRLAYLTDHSGAVNVVRFSPCGTYLASGSDDRCIIIYELRPGRAQAAFGGAAAAHAPSVENWRAKEMIRGHNSNVVDLSWSKDSKLLASASYDNKVIIWNISSGKHASQVHAVEHQGFAKGVAWDPLGSYLASQGDDGVRVWRTSNWAQEAHITKNLLNAPQQNYHLR